MFCFKEHFQLISFSLFVVFISLIVNIYVVFIKPPADYYLEFKEFFDVDLQRELRHKINWYFENWNDTKKFTEQIGHCYAVCKQDESFITDQISYHSDCQTHPLVVYDNDVTEERLLTMTVAAATVPCMLELKQSNIPNAGRGIFTKYKIPKGWVFGPYAGVILSDYGEEGDRARGGGYAWKINRNKENGEEDNFNIDGVDEATSNWLRWVNSARWYEEQNMVPLLFNQTAYYMTYKDVEPNTELLIWYGTNYARNVLHIYTLKGSNHNWDDDFAPLKDITICPTCPLTEGETDDVQQSNVVEEDDHHSEDLVHHHDDETEDTDKGEGEANNVNMNKTN